MEKKKKLQKQKDKCSFCLSKETPDYKRYEELSRYTTDRSKILNRTSTLLCSKHQRLVAREIKRARHLALFPFQTQIR